MALELETKFALEDCLTLEKMLPGTATRVKPWHFESNTVYDRDGELFGQDMLLRLRVADTNVLTLKTPAPQETPHLKARMETECLLQNPDQMDAILHALGYQPALRYEKFRAVWQLGAATLFFDILPFGHFLEIEGTADEISRCSSTLGLNPQDGLAANYHALHQKWRASLGLTPDTNFVFSEHEKDHLMRVLHCNPV